MIQFIESSGLRFAYLIEGTGPLVLMIHGFPDTPHTWDAARPAVAKLGYRVVTPFTRGYAPTSIPEPPAYDTDTLGRDILGLIDAFGEKSAIVVGHDWGASAAYAAAGLAPEKVRMLVTVAIPHPASIIPTPMLAWKVRHFLSLRMSNAVEMASRNDFAYIDELVHRWSPAWKVPPGETDAVKRAFREPGCLDAALAYYRAMSTKTPAGHRKPITMPAIAFAGETDIISPSAYERARKRYRASYEIIRMPGGHFMHREDPEKFVAELTAAIQRFEQSSGNGTKG